MKTIYLSIIIISAFFSQSIYAQREFVLKYPSVSEDNISLNVYQTDQNQQRTKEYYFEKSKRKKTTAWILLGAGTAMAIGGAIGFDNSWDKSSEYTKTDIFGFITLAGIISDLVSIPFFISSAKNKKKALSITFVIPNNPPGTNNTLSQGIQTVVKIRF